MTNEEFSNAFDTLLNAYKHKSEFGDQSSIADVTIDEYEKSIFLTQAQDNIVKSYFTKSLNPNGEGFDDSTRRQMDFSTLITIKEFSSLNRDGGFSDRGYVVSFKDDDFERTSGSTTYKAYPLFIINEKVKTADASTTTSFVKLSDSEKSAIKVGDEVYTLSSGNYTKNTVSDSNLASLKAGDLYKKQTLSRASASYVVVPLNYKEYDRMMSRAYSEPLKRQAWRLFEANSSDLSRQAEIILRSDAAAPSKYVVRYVRRPQPIVLVDLTNTDNGLSIDGVKKVTTCELNPIVHQEILQEAVRLALASNGIETREMKAAREAANQR